MEIIVLGHTLKRAVTLLHEIFRENLDQVDLKRSKSPCTLVFKDGTVFVAKSTAMTPGEIKGCRFDQIFYEEGCLREVTSLSLQLEIIDILRRSTVPIDFQLVELKNDYMVVDTTLSD